MWFVAFALYAYDAIRPLGRPTVFIRLQIGIITAEFIEPTFRIAGSGIRIPNLLRPDIIYLPIDFCQPGEEFNETDQNRVNDMAAVFSPVATSSVASGIIMLILVPILAICYALAWAILVGLIASYAAILYGWISLRINRQKHCITARELRYELLHCLLCPPNAINMAHRIGDRQKLPYDAKVVLKTYAPYEVERYTQYMEAVDDA